MINTEEIRKILEQKAEEHLQQKLIIKDLTTKTNFIRHIIHGLQNQNILLTPKKMEIIVTKAEEMYKELGIQPQKTQSQKLINELIKESRKKTGFDQNTKNEKYEKL